ITVTKFRYESNRRRVYSIKRTDAFHHFSGISSHYCVGRYALSHKCTTGNAIAAADHDIADDDGVRLTHTSPFIIR
ncbi:MAG TPA: hypothetical protein VKB53_02525, partial [Gammaproteobacteria bacterium]|nr:hypothetical protein [Gammaproteobacteria bacterium]